MPEREALSSRLQLFEGESEPRINDYVLGERLEYAATNRSNIRKVIARLTKSGDLEPGDVKTICTPRTQGPVTRVVRELWLTEEGALQVAADIRTRKARALRREIIRGYADYRRKGGALATTEPTQSLEARLTTTLATALAGALQPLLAHADMTHGIYVTREQVACLQKQAREIAKIRGDRDLRRVWKERAEQLCVVPSRTPFATVQRRMFEMVWDELHEQYNTLKRAKAAEPPQKPPVRKLELVRNPPSKSRPKRKQAP